MIEAYVTRFLSAEKATILTGLHDIDIIPQRPTSRPCGKASEIITIRMGQLAHLFCLVEPHRSGKQAIILPEGIMLSVSLMHADCSSPV